MIVDYKFLKEKLFPPFLNSADCQIFFHDDLWNPIVGEDDRSLGEKLTFHWYLLCDRNMVAMSWPAKDGGVIDPKTAIRQGSLGNRDYEFVLSSQPVRLTFGGQEFAQNLKKLPLKKLTGWGIDVVQAALKASATTVLGKVMIG